MMLLTTLEFEVLGIDMFEEISANLRGECDRLFGPRPMARVQKIVRAAFPLDSTEAAVELAHKVMRCIRAERRERSFRPWTSSSRSPSASRTASSR